MKGKIKKTKDILTEHKWSALKTDMEIKKILYQLKTLKLDLVVLIHNIWQKKSKLSI